VSRKIVNHEVKGFGGLADEFFGEFQNGKKQMRLTIDDLGIDD
jgi:hypothetical protein